MEYLLFECPFFPGRESSQADTLLQDGLFRARSDTDHAKGVLLVTFPPDGTPPVAATACFFMFLFYPASALGRQLPW